MAQKALANDDIGEMTDEVIRFIEEKKVGFHKAFSWVAHRRDIYFSKERRRYNYFFRKVLERYSSRSKPSLKKSLEGPRPWQHGKILRNSPSRPKPSNCLGRTRLKPGIEVEEDEDPYLSPQMCFHF